MTKRSIIAQSKNGKIGRIITERGWIVEVMVIVGRVAFGRIDVMVTQTNNLADCRGCKERWVSMDSITFND